jgi:hypothetical protein
MSELPGGWSVDRAPAIAVDALGRASRTGSTNSAAACAAHDDVASTCRPARRRQADDARPPAARRPGPRRQWRLRRRHRARRHHHRRRPAPRRRPCWRPNSTPWRDRRADRPLRGPGQGAGGRTARARRCRTTRPSTCTASTCGCRRRPGGRLGLQGRCSCRARAATRGSTSTPCAAGCEHGTARRRSWRCSATWCSGPRTQSGPGLRGARPRSRRQLGRTPGGTRRTRPRHLALAAAVGPGRPGLPLSRRRRAASRAAPNSSCTWSTSARDAAILPHPGRAHDRRTADRRRRTALRRRARPCSAAPKVHGTAPAACAPARPRTGRTEIAFTVDAPTACRSTTAVRQPVLRAAAAGGAAEAPPAVGRADVDDAAAAVPAAAPGSAPAFETTHRWPAAALRPRHDARRGQGRGHPGARSSPTAPSPTARRPSRGCPNPAAGGQPDRGPARRVAATVRPAVRGAGRGVRRPTRERAHHADALTRHAATAAPGRSAHPPGRSGTALRTAGNRRRPRAGCGRSDRRERRRLHVPRTLRLDQPAVFGQASGTLTLERLDGSDVLGAVGSGTIKLERADLGVVPLFTAIYAQLPAADRPRFDGLDADLHVADRLGAVRPLDVRSTILAAKGKGSLGARRLPRRRDDARQPARHVGRSAS